MESLPAERGKASPLKQRWTESKTRGFILAYLSRPELWNTNSQSYTQKTEKNQAYSNLMEDFGLTMNEVKNKIRIFRTTYSQERKKEETIPNYTPKLSWYADMKSAFGEGKVKSFSKIKREFIPHPPRSIKKEDTTTDPLVQIEYEDDYANEDGIRDEDISDHTTSCVIVEPYDEEESYSRDNQIVNNIAYSPPQKLQKQSSDSSSISQNHSNSKSQTLLSSNELFLQSLRSSLDQLSDEKNMRARIKIQEILYQILYETP